MVGGGGGFCWWCSRVVGFAILNVCNFECCFSSSDGRSADCLVVSLFGCLVLWLLGCAGVLTLLLCFVF